MVPPLCYNHSFTVYDPVSSSAATGKMDIGHAVQKALYGTFTDSQFRSHMLSGCFRILSDHLSQAIKRIQLRLVPLCGTLWILQSAIGTLCGTLRFTLSCRTHHPERIGFKRLPEDINPERCAKILQIRLSEPILSGFSGFAEYQCPIFR